MRTPAFVYLLLIAGATALAAPPVGQVETL